MHILIDVIIVLVFVITIFHYHRIGFVKALFSVCKFFISVVIAFSLASSLGSVISEKIVREPIRDTINDIIQSNADELNEGENISTLVEKLPGSIKILIDSSDSTTDVLDEDLENKLIDDETVAAVSDIISQKISNIISNIIAFLILFAISMILMSILATILDKLCQLPVIKQANKFLGALFGILCGAFHVFAASTIITLVLYLVGIDNSDFSVEAMREKTVVYSFIERIDLSYLIIEFLKSI